MASWVSTFWAWEEVRSAMVRSLSNVIMTREQSWFLRGGSGAEGDAGVEVPTEELVIEGFITTTELCVLFAA